VPALKLDDGRVLTEGPAVVQYLADQKPETRLAPPLGSFERYQLMELLSYLTSEVHKGFSPLFNPAITPDSKAAALANLDKKLHWVSDYLGDKQYLLGETFTVADAYLFTLLSWSSHVGIDLAKYHVLTNYMSRVGHRPKVEEALKAEGLI
jgi:glutathione S-transferase